MTKNSHYRANLVEADLPVLVHIEKVECFSIFVMTWERACCPHRVDSSAQAMVLF
jgi:hypothetical protein